MYCGVYLVVWYVVITVSAFISSEFSKSNLLSSCVFSFPFVSFVMLFRWTTFFNQLKSTLYSPLPSNFCYYIFYIIFICITFLFYLCMNDIFLNYYYQFNTSNQPRIRFYSFFPNFIPLLIFKWICFSQLNDLNLINSRTLFLILYIYSL